ncbi:MAG: hypothetical protein M3R65_08595 [Gemmatimonadota bacterium]|nr:hypothetical protein [Gemmatimonadota bacterium]
MKVASVALCVPLLASSLVAGSLLAQSTSGAGVPGQGGQGITVKLLPPSPETREPLRYVLSEPGYVAAFVIYPGSGVRLLYPTVNVPERLQSAGYHSDQLFGDSFDNDIYNVVLGPSIGGPSYLYVIVSRHPLDVARYVHRPTQLASAVGLGPSRSFYVDVAFDALLNNAVSLGDDTSWDSDVYMLWPASAASTRGTTWTLRSDPYGFDGMPAPVYQYVLCTDGSERLVPSNYPFHGCPGQSHLRPAAETVVRTQQSASAARASSRAEQPTVLPTIVGHRESSAERLAANRDVIAQHRSGFTMANGAGAVTRESSDNTAIALEGLSVRPSRSAEEGRRDRDALRQDLSPERRARYADEQRMRLQNAEISRAPQLAPNPRLSPNPELSPNPGFPSRSGIADDGRRGNGDTQRTDSPMRSPRAVDDNGQQMHQQEFREQRQQQAQQRQEQAQQRQEQPTVARPEPVRSAPPPPPPPPPTSVPAASARMDAPSHGGRVGEP